MQPLPQDNVLQVGVNSNELSEDTALPHPDNDYTEQPLHWSGNLRKPTTPSVIERSSFKTSKFSFQNFRATIRTLWFSKSFQITTHSKQVETWQGVVTAIKAGW